MKKKLEEELARLAFGDLSPEETARLEQKVAGDKEAGRVLLEYRDMRSGLKALHEIPEHQLSTERLRHAVLNQGLKPKSRPQLGWLWMPATATALAFGIMVLRNGQQPSLAAVGTAASINKTAAPSIAMNDAQDDPFRFASANGDIMSVAATQPAPKMTIAFNRSARRHRVDSQLVADLKAKVEMEFVNRYMVDNNPKNTSMTTVSGSISASKPSTAASIVMIDSAQDNSTGAHKATEVDSAGDVIVGG